MALAIFVRRTGARFVWMIGLSLLGVLLGRFGVWLPWSTDCALYALIFFGIGMLLRKYQMFAYCQAHPYICFLLAPIWLYFVQSGTMELGRRHYNLYGLGVIGAVCGTLVVYTVVALTASRLPNWLQKFATLLGQATMYILMVHTLSASRIELFLETQLGLQRDNLPNFLLATVLQLVVAIPVFLLTQKLQAYFAAKKAKKSRLEGLHLPRWRIIIEITKVQTGACRQAERKVCPSTENLIWIMPTKGCLLCVLRGACQIGTLPFFHFQTEAEYG